MTAYLVTILTLVCNAMILGLALNLQWGLCGMVNFGVAGFFALGAYSAALIALSGAGTLAATLVAALVCALASAGTALISLRLSDEYLAIFTLGFGEAIRLVVLSEEWLTGGSLGLPGIPRPLWGLVSAKQYEMLFLGILIGVVLVLFIMLEILQRSPFGRAVRAVREDDVVVATLGKNVTVLRVKAFALGGAIIGVAGAFHAYYLTYIDPSQFSAIITAYTFMAVIAGGRGSNKGLLFGAAAIMCLIEGSRFLKDLVQVLDATQLAAIRLILIGLGLILFLIYRPQGFAREYRLKASPPPSMKRREAEDRHVPCQPHPLHRDSLRRSRASTRSMPRAAARFAIKPRSWRNVHRARNRRHLQAQPVLLLRPATTLVL